MKKTFFLPHTPHPRSHILLTSFPLLIASVLTMAMFYECRSAYANVGYEYVMIMVNILLNRNV
nr:hypothetical protein GZ17F1_31 [uncultured archaeon GZfos17F1]